MGKKPELSGSEVLKYHQEKLADLNRHGHSAPPDAVWWGYFARTTWSGTSWQSWHATHIAAQHDTITLHKLPGLLCSSMQPRHCACWKGSKMMGPIEASPYGSTCHIWQGIVLQNSVPKNDLRTAWECCKVNQGESRWIKVIQSSSCLSLCFWP